MVNQSQAQVWPRWLRTDVDHFWPRPRGRFAGRYLAAVLGEAWWPSLASSPAMTSSTHNGFSFHIRRIRARVSAAMGGRPTGRRERRRQKSFQRKRCHRRTVSGRTIATAARSEGNTLVMTEMASRSRALSRGRGAALLKTMTCWRSRAFLARRAARERTRPRARARLVISPWTIAADYQQRLGPWASDRRQWRAKRLSSASRTEFLRPTTRR